MTDKQRKTMVRRILNDLAYPPRWRCKAEEALFADAAVKGDAWLEELWRGVHETAITERRNQRRTNRGGTFTDCDVFDGATPEASCEEDWGAIDAGIDAEMVANGKWPGKVRP
jgi:hypothetical protein